MINNPIIYKFFKDFTNHRKKINRAVVFSCRLFPNILKIQGPPTKPCEISEIINDKNVNKNLPIQFNKTEKISRVYALTKTIRSKIFNHKQFIKTLETKDILDEQLAL